MIEQPQVFRVNEESVVALLGIPENTSRAVMFVTGGNQYRVGTHRMFVRIARALNDRGIATMRFDRPGTGDQLGAFVEFDQLQADLKCAAEAFRAHLPQHCELWVLGLCDGATAATMGVNEISAQGLVLINPWVEDAASESRVRLRQYYVSRLVSRDFWRKLLAGSLDWFSSAADLKRHLRALWSANTDRDFVDSMRRALTAYDGSVYVLLSDEDLTAARFSELILHNDDWGAVMRRPTFHVERFEGADHTFSNQALYESLAAALTRLTASETG